MAEFHDDISAGGLLLAYSSLPRYPMLPAGLRCTVGMRMKPAGGYQSRKVMEGRASLISEYCSNSVTVTNS